MICFIFRTDFEILFEYGNFLYSTSKNTDAERYYGEALEVEPNNILALTFMALNKLILNQLDEAKTYIMKAIEIQPNHEYVQFCVGRILYAREEFEEAKTYLIRAVEQNPDIENEKNSFVYSCFNSYCINCNIFFNPHLCKGRCGCSLCFCSRNRRKRRFEC